MSSAESHWQISAPDGAVIYGIKNAAPKPNDSCIVIVHGLTGYPNEYLHKTAARYFTAKGYDVFRPALYSDGPGARRLRDSTLATHAADLQAILAGPVAAYRRVFLTGHSYGGPTIMLAQPQNVAAVSLWDPSFDLPRLWKLLPAHQENGLWFDGDGVECVINTRMLLDEVPQYDAARCLDLARTFRPPVQVIHAEHCIYNAPDEVSWHSAGNPANERHLVAGADHCFVNGDTVMDVLAHTERWFARFAAP